MRKVKGRLIFSKKVDGKDKPIANAFLELWDLDVIENDFLASGQTDKDGKFVISYDPKKGSRWNDIPDLVLRFVDREYSYDKQGQVISNWFIVKSFDGGSNIKAKVFDFGTINAAFWEYESKESFDKVAFTPRVGIIDGKSPQAQRPGRTHEQFQVGIRNLASHSKDKIIAKFSDHHPTNKQIEEDYPLNRTRKLGKKARSDAFISDLVLNGFNPCLLKKGTENNSFYVDFAWNGLELDKTHFAPNTTANFKLKRNKLVLESIALQKRLGGSESAHALYRKPKIYTPKAPEWDRVKRIFRCNYFAFGEVNTHLAETHLNIEQYIVPMRRNLLRSPVAHLLLPHFYGTTEVNLAANAVLLANDGLVQKCSALTPNSVKQVSQLHFGSLNWKGWRPRKPLCPQHTFADLGELYWEVLTKYIHDFFKKNKPEIEKYWSEIKAMSDELIANSLPFIRGNDDSYYDLGEINTVKKVHPLVNGIEVAVSPVTGSHIADNAGIRNLKQLCTYLLYHATFKHSWFNDLQYDMGGEIEFATLGITDDISNMRVDEKKVVPPEEALEHPFITYILNYTEYGYIMRNEDNDMNPDLINALLRNKDKFKSLGYDIRSIRSCINI